MTALVVPGVRVEARFDVLPPLPAPSGILGAVGIVDRIPHGDALTGVTKVSELRDVFGPGIESSMPEVAHALANGVSEVVIAPVRGGSPARLELVNKSNAVAVTLRARSNGAWGNSLAAEVRETTVKDSANPSIDKTIRVSLKLYRSGALVESFDDMNMDEGSADFFFDVINRRSRYVVAIDPRLTTSLAVGAQTLTFTSGSATVKTSGNVDAFLLLPAEGVDTAGLSVALLPGDLGNLDIDVFQNGLQERLRDLTIEPDDENYLPDALITQSRFLRVRALDVPAANEQDAWPQATGAPLAFGNTAVTAGSSPGTSASVADYKTAIDRLAEDTRIDLVLASIEPGRDDEEVRQIHEALVAHAVTQSDKGAPRIAFGSVTAKEAGKLDAVKDHAARVRSRRFVLVAPPGAEGAVAGLVGRMSPKDSPTFKNLPLFGVPASHYSESALNRLLGPTTNLLVVQDRAGRGVVVLKGIDTTGDQISVTRVADNCIRETKAIAENFIGQLNTDDARVALRQQITATLLRLEREGALVPSTDGKDPAFVVDVYSTQQDFAQGIVRIDIAVRPVRSIDYIYATIRVKN
jgi:hypothetical protein